MVLEELIIVHNILNDVFFELLVTKNEILFHSQTEIYLVTACLRLIE